MVGVPAGWDAGRLLAQPVETAAEHREFEALERIGGWERVIAWAQARQLREMTSFMDRAQARNEALGAYTSQAYDSAVAEVGLMLRVSARTASARVNDALSLCTRLPGTLAALECGRITLPKARIIDAETMNLSEEHASRVEAMVLAKARQQTPGQLRVATRQSWQRIRRLLRNGPSTPPASVWCSCGRTGRDGHPLRLPARHRRRRRVRGNRRIRPATTEAPATSAAWTPAAPMR